MYFFKDHEDILNITTMDVSSPIITITGDYRDIWLYLNSATGPSHNSHSAPSESVTFFLEFLATRSILPNNLSIMDACQHLPEALLVKQCQGSFEVKQPQEQVQIHAVPASGVEDPYTFCYPNEYPYTGMCK